MAAFIRDKVYEYIRKKGDVWTARWEITLNFGTDPNATSKMLKRLVSDGFLESRGTTSNTTYRAREGAGVPVDNRARTSKSRQDFVAALDERDDEPVKQVFGHITTMERAALVVEAFNRSLTVERCWPSPVVREIVS